MPEYIHNGAEALKVSDWMLDVGLELLNKIEALEYENTSLLNRVLELTAEKEGVLN